MRGCFSGICALLVLQGEAGAEPREKGIPAILGTAAGGWAQCCGAPEWVRNHWNQNLGWEHELQDHRGAEEMPLNQDLKH